MRCVVGVCSSNIVRLPLLLSAGNVYLPRSDPHPPSFLSFRSPQICCSLFSIAAGGSLGPEAPLVAVSASASGYISMQFFKHDMVMVRKCTIIGMSAGLSAFFGVQLGGECSLFL